MKKKSRKAAKRAKTPKDIIDIPGALAIVERLDNEFDDSGEGPGASLYRRIFFEAFEQEKRRIASMNHRGLDVSTLLDLVTAVDAFVTPIDVIRRAGFVQGYEYLRSLLLTGGAR